LYSGFCNFLPILFLPESRGVDFSSYKSFFSFFSLFVVPYLEKGKTWKREKTWEDREEDEVDLIGRMFLKLKLKERQLLFVLKNTMALKNISLH